MRKLTLIQVLFLIATAGMAQTPDGETPAQEDVCAGLEGQAFGLCNAYCEAMDCDSDAPNASPSACSSTRDQFLLSTGGDELPCVLTCPCAFPVPFQDYSGGTQVNVTCQAAGTGFTSLAGHVLTHLIFAFEEGEVRSCRTVSGTQVLEEFDDLSAEELHACSEDLLAYLRALRAARDDLTFGGDDLDSCEPVPLPE